MRPHNPSIYRLFGASIPHRSSIQPCIRTGTLLSHNSFTSNDGQPARPKRFYGRARGPRREQAANVKFEIGVDSLGKPGEIVVVPSKKRGRPSKRQDKPPTAPPESSLSLASVLEDLEEEQAVIDTTAVHKRIEEIRGGYQPTQKLSVTEWRELRSTLSSSFTTPQLSEYSSTFEPDLSEPKDDMETWQPESIVSLEADTQGHEIAHHLSRKALVAEQILRDCWQLSLADEVGHFDLYLPRPFITLLLNAQEFSFDQLASLHKSSIDITQSLGLVRITGPKATCKSIREIIEDAKARVCKDDVEIDLSAHRSRLTPAFLEWVCQSYNVVLDEDTAGGPAKILYLTENQTGADNARRTLGLALHATDPAPRPFSTYLPAAELANIYSYAPGAAGSWLEQQEPWFRWAMPAVQANSLEPPRTPFFDSHQTWLSNGLLKLLRKQPSPTTSPENKFEVQESVVASIGQCLFGHKPTLEENTLSASQLGRLSLPRTFVNDIPRIKPFLETLELVQDPEDSTRPHTIRLIPSPKFASILPEMDVRFESTPTKPVHIENVRFILQSNSVDYLIPENTLDLRFTRSLYIEASREEMEESGDFEGLISSIEKPLLDAFNPSTNDRSASQQDTLPLRGFCQIPLPRYLCQSSGTDTSAALEQPLADTPEKSLTAEYILPPVAGLEATAVQYYEFEDGLLRYRFYENDSFLASRVNEILLNMELTQSSEEPTVDQGEDSIESEFHSFYKSACNVAFAIHKARDVHEQD